MAGPGGARSNIGCKPKPSYARRAGSILRQPKSRPEPVRVRVSRLPAADTVWSTHTITSRKVPPLVEPQPDWQGVAQRSRLIGGFEVDKFSEHPHPGFRCARG